MLFRILKRIIQKIKTIVNSLLLNKNINTSLPYKKVLTGVYFEKNFLTPSELNFYNKIKDLENYYKIVPQLNLATVVKKSKNNKYINELFKNIDFAIFTNDYSKLLLLIELNDSSHNQKNRIKRDKKLHSICNDAGIKLITFYTKYTNEREYVVSRIINEIRKDEVV